MKYITVILFVLSLARVSFADAAPLNITLELKTLNEAIAIDFLALDGAKTWVTAQIVPAANSPESSVPGEYIDGATGKIVTPPGAKEMIIVSGKLLVSSGVFKAIKPAQLEFRIEWPVSLDDQRAPENRLGTTALVDGGTVICPSVDHPTELASLTPMFLIPKAWEGEAAAAGEFLWKNHALFEKAKDHKAELEQALGMTNPFVRIAALRALVSSNQVDDKDVTAALATEDPSIIAGVIRTLSSQGEDQLVTARKAIEKQLSQVKKGDVLKGYALGAMAAQTGNAGQGKLFGSLLIQKVDAQLRDIPKDDPARKDIEAIVTAANL